PADGADDVPAHLQQRHDGRGAGRDPARRSTRSPEVPHAHRPGRRDVPRPPGLRVEQAHLSRGPVDRAEQLRRDVLHPDRSTRSEGSLEGVQADAICVIFKHVPLETQVWVNRSELLKVLAFQKTLQGTSFPAIRYWMTRESEVFLEIEHVTRRTCAMRGG